METSGTLVVPNLTGVVENSSSTPCVCKKCTPKMTETNRLLTTTKLCNILFSLIATGNSRCALIGRQSPDAVTRCKVNISSLVNVPFNFDKLSWCISDTADPECDIMSVSTPPIVPGNIDLDLTAATVIILLSQRPIGCGHACFLVQVPNSCLTENTAVRSALLYHTENSKGDMRLVDDEDTGVDNVQLDCN